MYNLNVLCRTNEEAVELFKVLIQYGFKWINRDILRADEKYTEWNTYANETCYYINPHHKTISYLGLYELEADDEGFILLEDFLKDQEALLIVEDETTDRYISKTAVLDIIENINNDEIKVYLKSKIEALDALTESQFKECEV